MFEHTPFYEITIMYACVEPALRTEDEVVLIHTGSIFFTRNSTVHILIAKF
jgi:hypothetical protein